METIAGFPFYPLEMTKAGKVFKAAQQNAILTAVKDTGASKITDLFVISHGWNNDMKDAHWLYTRILTSMAGLLAGSRAVPAGRKIAVVGIFWPSKKFADEELIPGGGAASFKGPGARDVTAAAVMKQLDALIGTFDKPDKAALNKAKKLVEKLEDSAKARREFVDLIRSVLPRPKDPLSDASGTFFKKSGDAILKALSTPVGTPPPPKRRGGAMTLGKSVKKGPPRGGAASLGDVFNGIKSAAQRLLNYATFYQMKERAGLVGGGVNGSLKLIRASRPDIRINLVGHSFGARLVTAAAAGAAEVAPASMTLLQGAFSHNGFTAKFDGTHDGFFRNVITEQRVTGPIVDTYTANDQAVGIAYPIAVRISGDNRLALGDANDEYGGLGRNGAVKMNASECAKLTMLGKDGKYPFVSGKVHNLLADAFVRSHNDVDGEECANVILRAAGL